MHSLHEAYEIRELSQERQRAMIRDTQDRRRVSTRPAKRKSLFVYLVLLLRAWNKS